MTSSSAVLSWLSVSSPPSGQLEDDNEYSDLPLPDRNPPKARTTGGQLGVHDSSIGCGRVADGVWRRGKPFRGSHAPTCARRSMLTWWRATTPARCRRRSTRSSGFSRLRSANFRCVPAHRPIYAIIGSAVGHPCREDFGCTFVWCQALIDGSRRASMRPGRRGGLRPRIADASDGKLTSLGFSTIARSLTLRFQSVTCDGVTCTLESWNAPRYFPLFVTKKLEIHDGPRFAVSAMPDSVIRRPSLPSTSVKDSQ